MRSDVEALARLLDETPELASARIGDSARSRTLLHVLTDWPGHRPNGAATVHALVTAGADVNAQFVGPHTETPLHWAASSDDVEVFDALLDAGADIDAVGGVIGDGTPLFDAAAFGRGTPCVDSSSVVPTAACGSPRRWACSPAWRSRN